VSWLTRHYDPIPFALFIKAAKERDRSILPPRPLIVTIDDGYQANVELIPVLVKYSFPIMIYLTAGLIGTSRKFWWLAVKEKGGDPQRLKRLPTNEFYKVLHDRFGYEPEKEFPERCALNWDEVCRLKKTGLVEFGSASLTHPMLIHSPDDMAWKEIVESKYLLESKLNEPIIHFCHPNGDHSAREKEMVKAAGYATGRSGRAGWANINASTDLYGLPVLRVADYDNIPQLSYALAGFDVLRKKLIQGKR
jgi:peptidoglycan/xylan/chitin deacetylase (PgdA/CDA1 family)